MAYVHEHFEKIVVLIICGYDAKMWKVHRQFLIMPLISSNCPPNDGGARVAQ